MAVKHAKTLTKQQLTATLRRAADSRYPDRDLVMVLLSVKAGLRAGEIAKLTWPMVVDAQGRIARHIELHDAAAKKRSGRTIPLHPDLRRSLRRLHKQNAVRGPVIRSERGEALRPSSVVNWFGRLYRELGFEGHVAFGAPHLHHQCRPAGFQGGRQPARCSAIGRPPFDRAHAGLYRG